MEKRAVAESFNDKKTLRPRTPVFQRPDAGLPSVKRPFMTQISDVRLRPAREVAAPYGSVRGTGS